MRRTRHLSDSDLLLAQDNDLSPGLREVTQAHLAGCAQCRRRMRMFSETSERLCVAGQDGDWMAGALRRRARARLEARLEEARLKRTWSLSDWRAYASGGPLAAVLAVVVVLTAITVTSQRSTSNAAWSSDDGPAEESGALPIRTLTPGATRTLPVAELCRNRPWELTPIPDSMREEVLRGYGMERVPDHEYELDYLVTPDLGGAPDPRNLWPERIGSRVWNARVKDQLETLLPQLVCQGTLDLATAQQDIATDWIAAYKKYFKTNRPVRLYSTLSFVTAGRPFDLEFP
jgi:hypothetical protein